MAFVPVGPGSGFYLTVSLVDVTANVSTLQYALRSIDFATAQTDSAAIINQLQVVSQAEVASYNISYRAEEDAFAYPAAGVENEIRARVVCQLAGGTKKATFDIPSPNPTLFVAPSGPNNEIVDTTDVGLIGYGALFEAGSYAFISDGEDLDFLVRGRKVSVKRGMRAS